MASNWERLASKLRPKPFSREEIDTMKRDFATHTSMEEKANVMLERWKHSYGTHATVRCLIESIMDAGFLKFAEDVFTAELTWKIRDEKESSSD